MGIESERLRFEERVFAAYYISTIVRNPAIPQPRISGALDFVSQDCMMKDEFCKRDLEGNYVRKDVSAMWHGWQLRAEEKEPVKPTVFIKLRYVISPNRRQLVVTLGEAADWGKMKELLDDRLDDFDSDSVMYDVFERLVANSELRWVSAGETGDLTEAPILGIVGENECRLAANESEAGYINVGGDEFGGIWVKLRSRWAFMDYMVTSPQRRLLETGSCTFTGGDLW